jgi:hypothetical protein
MSVMRRYGVWCIVAVWGAMALGLSSAANAAGWVPYGKDEEGQHFYQLDTRKKASPGIVRVWTQVIFSPEGRAKYIEKRQKYKFPITGYEKLSHRTVLYELNCFSEKRENSVQEVFEVTTDKATLDYARAGTYKDWQEIPAGCMLDRLADIVCPERR